MGRGLEDDILRQGSVLAHLPHQPQHAFVVDQEAATTQVVAALDVLDRPQDLLHAAQTIADPDSLGRKDGGARVIGRAWPDSTAAVQRHSRGTAGSTP